MKSISRLHRLYDACRSCTHMMPRNLTSFGSVSPRQAAAGGRKNEHITDWEMRSTDALEYICLDMHTSPVHVHPRVCRRQQSIGGLFQANMAADGSTSWFRHRGVRVVGYKPEHQPLGTRQLSSQTLDQCCETHALKTGVAPWLSVSRVLV